MTRVSRIAVVLLLAVLSLALTRPAYAATYPTLSTGATGANVTSLQHLLTSRGYSTAADGDFGSGTKAAVQAFQSGAGLGADG
ncbi:peptidoglycan-binding protein, partial [Nocardioides hankookensis]